MHTDYFLGTDVLGADPTYRDAGTVFAVQTALLARGYKLEKGADGKWGPETAKAIKNVQLQTGLPQTGEITDKLLEVLGLRAPVAPAPAPGGAAPAPAKPSTPAPSPAIEQAKDVLKSAQDSGAVQAGVAALNAAVAQTGAPTELKAALDSISRSLSGTPSAAEVEAARQRALLAAQQLQQQSESSSTTYILLGLGGIAALGLGYLIIGRR